MCGSFHELFDENPGMALTELVAVARRDKTIEHRGADAVEQLYSRAVMALCECVTTRQFTVESRDGASSKRKDSAHLFQTSLEAQ